MTRHKIRAFYSVVEANEMAVGAINLFQVGGSFTNSQRAVWNYQS